MNFKLLQILTLVSVLFVVACATPEKAEDVDKDTLPLVLTPVRFNDLPGWGNDQYGEVLLAFQKSCERILKKPPQDKFGPDGIGGVYGDWRPACEELPSVMVTDARAFFERHFMPYEASYEGGEKEGLFTGYYEPGLKGSRIKTPPYVHPLYKRPDDLVMVDLGEFREDLKGQRIAGRVKGAHLKPYEDRQKITEGKWPHNDEVLLWVDDPIDSFFLHIQGSGRVDLNDGSHMRVGYDGQNGHVYYAIGRELVKRGYMEKEKVSLQSIRDWLKENPEEGREIMYLNKSYVFFRELEEDGSLGGEGVVLTPERSLAVDRTKVPYGVPLWVDIKPPTENESAVRRMMVAQDTGGAIRGAVRGDVFWGYGDRAAYLAGHMKSKGRYWLLLPRTVTQ